MITMMMMIITMMNSNNHDHFTDFLTAFQIFLACSILLHLLISSTSCGRETKLAARQLSIVR